MNILILNSQKDKFYLNKLKKILLNYKKDKLYIYQKKTFLVILLLELRMKMLKA